MKNIRIVEETLAKSGLVTILEMKQMFSKHTIMALIKYLEHKGKVIVHDNKVLWTFKPQSKLKNMKGTMISGDQSYKSI